MADTALIEAPETAVQTTPMEMLALAVSGGADPAVIDQLMTLQERWKASQGRAKFDLAISEAKPNFKPILKSGKGHNDNRHETLADIAHAVDEALGEHGLSYRFRATQDNGQIAVTCIISHRAGHYEETTLCAGPDKTGNKNDVQAIGSTATYLERYTLKLALGLAAANDDDGQAAGSGGLTIDQAQELDTLIRKYKADPAKFYQSRGATGPGDLPSSKFNDAKAALVKWGEAQKAREAANATG